MMSKENENIWSKVEEAMNHLEHPERLSGGSEFSRRLMEGMAAAPERSRNTEGVALYAMAGLIFALSLVNLVQLQDQPIESVISQEEGASELFEEYAIFSNDIMTLF